MPEQKILELEDIHAGYSDNIILQGVNLTIFENDFVGVIGANGSGKTTLLKVILGLIKPFKGNLKFFLEDKGLPNRNIGYLPQISIFDRQFPLTVFDAIIQGLASKIGLYKNYRIQDREKTFQIIEDLGITSISTKSVGQLSGGQLQRVFLARALISSPKLLLLDEPHTFIDKSFESDFFDVLKELNKDITIILVSHDLGMISSYVKTIACVNRTVYHHKSNEINQKLLDNYNCPIDLIGHGHLPHRVLKYHQNQETE